MIGDLATVKAYLGIDPADASNDVFLTQQIGTISDAIEKYCRRVFSVQTYVQTFYNDDYGFSNVIPLYMYPVKSVTSVVNSIDPSNPVVDFSLHKPTGILKRTGYVPWFNPCYGSRGSTTQITYVAGFDTIPSPVMDCFLSLVQQRYNLKSSGVGLNFGSDVQSVSIPGTISVAFDYTLSNNDRATSFGNILGDYLNVLDQYRSSRAIVGTDRLEYVETM